MPFTKNAFIPLWDATGRNRRSGCESMALEILQQNKKFKIDLEKLRQWLHACLRRLQLSGSAVSILLTDDASLRRLNRTYRHQDKPTDILSFGMREFKRRQDPLPPHPEVLGDLAVSLETVRRQARDRNVPWEEELHLVLAHGLLHLLGYDHARRVDAERMFALQAWLLQPAPRKGSGQRGPVRGA